MNPAAAGFFLPGAALACQPISQFRPHRRGRRVTGRPQRLRVLMAFRQTICRYRATRGRGPSTRRAHPASTQAGRAGRAGGRHVDRGRRAGGRRGVPVPVPVYGPAHAGSPHAGRSGAAGGSWRRGDGRVPTCEPGCGRVFLWAAPACDRAGCESAPSDNSAYQMGYFSLSDQMNFPLYLSGPAGQGPAGRSPRSKRSAPSQGRNRQRAGRDGFRSARHADHRGGCEAAEPD